MYYSEIIDADKTDELRECITCHYNYFHNENSIFYTACMLS